MAASNDHVEHEHSARPYIFTFVALAVFTILTYTAAQFDFGVWNFAIAMVIAVTKASLVMLFFMHLIDTRGASRLVVAIAFLFVFLLITLVITDVSTRWPLALPPGSFRSLGR